MMPRFSIEGQVREDNIVDINACIYIEQMCVHIRLREIMNLLFSVKSISNYFTILITGVDQGGGGA